MDTFVNRVTEGVANYEKVSGRPEAIIRHKVDLFERAHKAFVGKPLSGKILDFGCGMGHMTGEMRKRDYDAEGVDLVEYWGKDKEKWGRSEETPQEAIGHLSTYEGTLPYSDESFDVLISDQTLEHVFDLESVLTEQSRVLKPGGISIQRFPSDHCPIEAHTRLPFTALHRFDGYLAFMAVIGVRNQFQKGMGWKDAYRVSKEIFGTTHYLSNREILRIASKMGEASFGDYLPISGSRLGGLYHSLGPLGPLAKPLLAYISMSQMLVITKKGLN